MIRESVDIPTPDGVADAFLCRPDSDAHPGVLLLMDVFGLRPAIEDIAERIAAGGYVVLAPNLFYRAGRTADLPSMADPAQRAGFWEAVKPLVEQLTTERLAADGAAYLDRLGQAAAPAAGPVAITGYCMGGRIGWRIAAAHPDRVAALACFHTGRLVTDEPDSPHLSAVSLRAELYFGFADQDASMTAEQIAVLEQTLRETGARYRAEVYPGARHGYTMADRPEVHDPAAAERHFEQLLALTGRVFG